MTLEEFFEWSDSTEAEQLELFEYLLWIRFRRLARTHTVSDHKG
ncbi:MAG: hypothetical protein AAF989_10490 [Planctomycetota bacterium]